MKAPEGRKAAISANSQSMHEADSGTSRLDRVLGMAWLDRVIAIVAFVPFGIAIWLMLRAPVIPIENLLLVVILSLLAVHMFSRRPPRRVTRNPLFWALTFGATYWPVCTWIFYTAGKRVAPPGVSLGICVVGFIISIWARVSLGRNIGFVPAQRQIVADGAYGFVRHPMYTGIFVFIAATLIAAFSWRNLALDATWIALFMIKSCVEESFLSESVEYSAYKSRVRWRWLPGIA